jgi:hypothetical protein
VKLTSGGKITLDEDQFDVYELDLRSTKSVFARLSASISFAVPKGTLPDGRTFRYLADTATEDQPAAAGGLPEVQGWSIEDRESGFRKSHVFYKQGSLKVEFEKRKGKTISGKMSLIVPADPDAETKEKPSSLEGQFTATLE